jgi:hypothetical protein
VTDVAGDGGAADEEAGGDGRVAESFGYELGDLEQANQVKPGLNGGRWPFEPPLIINDMPILRDERPRQCAGRGVPCRGLGHPRTWAA